LPDLLLEGWNVLHSSAPVVVFCMFMESIK
jgi:hypothetical protein